MGRVALGKTTRAELVSLPECMKEEKGWGKGENQGFIQKSDFLGSSWGPHQPRSIISF